MSDEKKYTERDLVLARRGAFISGANYRDIYCACPARVVCGAEYEARLRFPLPKITRPRMVKDPHPEYDQHWRCIDGVLQYGWPRSDTWVARDAHWTTGCCRPTDARVRLWADLLAHPTEKVEAED